MSLETEHAWQRHTSTECDWIQESTGLQPGASIVDIGCGNGRHVRELEDRGFKLTGIETTIDLATIAQNHAKDAKIIRNDATSHDLQINKNFDAALLLYDVLGSSTANTDKMLLKNAFRWLRPGGQLVGTVMNAALTESKLPSSNKPESLDEFMSWIKELEPSNEMEATGNIF